jgi:hypothetical protein
MAHQLPTGKVAVPGTLTRWLTDYLGVRADELVGCTDEEIGKVESFAGPALPAAYKQMLREIGKGLGRGGVHHEFDRADMLYPDVLGVREIAAGVIQHAGGDLTLLDRAFPFYNWEVYRICLLDLAQANDDPPVLLLSEVTGQARRASETFSEFLATKIRDLAEIRARIAGANASGVRES